MTISKKTSTGINGFSMSMIKTEHRQNHMMVKLSDMGQSIESKRPQTIDMNIDNTRIATVVTAIPLQI